MRFFFLVTLVEPLEIVHKPSLASPELADRKFKALNMECIHFKFLIHEAEVRQNTKYVPGKA